MRKTGKYRKKLMFCCLVLLVMILVIGSIAMYSMKKSWKQKQGDLRSQKTEEVPFQNQMEVETEKMEEVQAQEKIEETEENETEDICTVFPSEEPDKPVEKQLKIAIDPGHQGKGNSQKEPIGPGASEQKAKVSSGTVGRTTKVSEYELTLDVAFKLQKELQDRGYEVYMIRESHDVDISNAQRAKMAADAQADVMIRIHANGSENSSISGALTMAPTTKNPYVSEEIVQECQTLAKLMIDTYCQVTEAKNQGVILTDKMSGLNWCTIPAVIIELGYMTNPEEDIKMETEEYQNLMIQGMADGIDKYFASK